MNDLSNYLSLYMKKINLVTNSKFEYINLL